MVANNMANSSFAFWNFMETFFPTFFPSNFYWLSWAVLLSSVVFLSPIPTVGNLDHPQRFIVTVAISCCCCLVASVVSNCVRPQRRQPTRLPRPWDSPGKNAGVGCHFLLQCMKVKNWRPSKVQLGTQVWFFPPLVFLGQKACIFF